MDRVEQTMWKREFNTRLLVIAERLSFSLRVEPFYCTLSVYDLDAGQRISEFFHLDLNKDDILNEQQRNELKYADKVFSY